MYRDHIGMVTCMQIPQTALTDLLVTLSQMNADFTIHREMCGNISIFYGCMVWIEKSVTRVTDRHHKACLVMPNSDPE